MRLYPVIPSKREPSAARERETRDPCAYCLAATVLRSSYNYLQKSISQRGSPQRFSAATALTLFWLAQHISAASSAHAIPSERESSLAR